MLNVDTSSVSLTEEEGQARGRSRGRGRGRTLDGGHEVALARLDVFGGGLARVQPEAQRLAGAVEQVDQLLVGLTVIQLQVALRHSARARAGTRARRIRRRRHTAADEALPGAEAERAHLEVPRHGAHQHAHLTLCVI